MWTGCRNFGMMDDGTLDDVAAGDGIFTSCIARWRSCDMDSSIDRWRFDDSSRNGPGLKRARLIEYGARSRAIEVGTLRANPLYVGISLEDVRIVFSTTVGSVLLNNGGHGGRRNSFVGHLPSASPVRYATHRSTHIMSRHQDEPLGLHSCR